LGEWRQNEDPAPTASAAADERQSHVLERGLKLLLAYADLDRRELTTQELAQHTGMALSTVYRYVGTLRRLGFLAAGSSYGSLVLGPRLVDLARVQLERAELPLVAFPLMRELSRITGETVLLVEPAGTFGLCTERVESSEPVRLSFAKGRMLPLHAGATVRALLAHLPEDVFLEVVRGGLRRYTEATICDPDRLARSLEEVRARGYALSLGEMDRDVRALAMPVRRHPEPWAVASLSVTGPAYRFTEAKVPLALSALRACVDRLEQRLRARGGERSRATRDA
jgi:DNA-binding IclR family transcriptional regulator